MAEPKPRVKVPKTAAIGDIIKIKSLIKHTMESGQRKDEEGNVIPRKIINKFVCEFNGKTVFAADIAPALAANPYFEFRAKVVESGAFNFTWTDDDGSVIEISKKIEVS